MGSGWSIPTGASPEWAGGRAGAVIVGGCEEELRGAQFQAVGWGGADYCLTVQLKLRLIVTFF